MEGIRSFEHRLGNRQFPQAWTENSPSFCAKVLQVIAALSPINLGNSKLVSAMAELVGTSEVELKAFIGLLVNAGVAVRGGRGHDRRMTAPARRDVRVEERRDGVHLDVGGRIAHGLRT